MGELNTGGPGSCDDPVALHEADPGPGLKFGGPWVVLLLFCWGTFFFGRV